MIAARLPFFVSAAVMALALATAADARPNLLQGSGKALPVTTHDTSVHAMVAAANPMAAEAGLKVLKEGGTAIDAAVAIQAVLGLVEPQSTSVAGGSFMVFYDAKTGRTEVYDGRETAPGGATPQYFFGPDGKPLGYVAAIMSGRSTGVPGAIASLYMAHKAHGRLPWSRLFSEGERLATNGFPVPVRMGRDIVSRFPQAGTADSIAYFTKPDGTRYGIGETLKNPAYAATLRAIATKGPDAILKGPIAEAIVAKTRETPGPAGILTLQDMASYVPTVDDPTCRPYRAYVICAPPPPGGGVGVLEILGILENTDIATRGPKDPQAWLEFVQASRLAYADRDHYVGDPKFVSVPVKGLLDPVYDAARAKLMDTDGLAKGTPPFGQPASAPRAAGDHTPEPGGTSHLVIVDVWGNVVSMTTTVESIFGNGRMVGGFYLNNQLTDFSLNPVEAGTGLQAQNAVMGGKRPRSSMAPVIVFEKNADGSAGKFVLAAGSPGGNSIVAYVAKALVALIDWEMDPKAALALSNIVARGPSVSAEKGTPDEVIAYLKSKGLNVMTDTGEDSGVQVVIRTKTGFVGAADPRREGIAIGY